MNYISLHYTDLALALVLIAISLGLSWLDRARLEKDLLTGTVRAFVQLMLVGYILKLVFDLSRWYWVLLMLGVMTTVAAQNAVSRETEPVKGVWPIMLGSIGVGAAITLGVVSVLVLRVKPWYTPQYVIPIAGMIIGNAMNAAALAVNRLASEVDLRRAEIDGALSLGATWRQAVTAARKEAVRAAMIPPISAMMVVGIVQLPGMMTGQIIGGVSPQEAVKYQVVVVYMITCAASITCLLAVNWASRAFFTRSQQLVA